jgi:hypothetical protein
MDPNPIVTDMTEGGGAGDSSSGQFGRNTSARSSLRGGKLSSSRLPAAKLGGSQSANIGEDYFESQFEEGLPPVDSSTYIQRLSDEENPLANDSLEWQQRANILKFIRAVVHAGLAETDEFNAVFRRYTSHLKDLVRSNRTMLQREALVTVAYLSVRLGARNEALCEQILGEILKNFNSGTGVLQSSCTSCMKFLFRHTQSPKLLAVLSGSCGFDSKATPPHRACAEMTNLVMRTWPPGLIERNMRIIQELITKGIKDQDETGRELSRQAFLAFFDYFPTEARQMLECFNTFQRKTLEKLLAERSGTVTSAGSSQNLHDSNGNLAIRQDGAFLRPFPPSATGAEDDSHSVSSNSSIGRPAANARVAGKPSLPSAAVSSSALANARGRSGSRTSVAPQSRPRSRSSERNQIAAGAAPAISSSSTSASASAARPSAIPGATPSAPGSRKPSLTASTALTAQRANAAFDSQTAPFAVPSDSSAATAAGDLKPALSILVTPASTASAALPTAAPASLPRKSAQLSAPTVAAAAAASSNPQFVVPIDFEELSSSSGNTFGLCVRVRLLLEK